MLGRTIGRFRVVAKLGEGGMGSVWKAEDTLLGRVVALKFLPESLAASESARQRFLREARSTSGLDHPHIATLFEIGEEDGRQFLAVAFVDGETVSDRVARGPLAPPEALRLAAEVADALAHAHGRGVVHRDVTSRNIMIAKDGRAMVIDFGLALRDHTARITTTGATFGTIPYMAPEVVRGGAADARSDLYGLGVVLYELLTGRLPFAQEHGVAALYASARRRPEPPSAHAAGIGAEVDRLALRLLTRDPERRGASAQSLAAELRALAQAPQSARVRAAVLPSQASSLRRSLAICPFGSGSAGEAGSDDALADGFAEAVSAALARLQQLRIVPPVVLRAAPDRVGDPRAAARALGAGLLLQGSVRRAGERMRVSYSMLDTRRGTQVAGDTLDGTAADLFALEDALVASVVRALKIDVALQVRRVQERTPVAAAAHEQYLRALGYLQRHDNLGMIENAIRLLEDLRLTEGDSALLHAALGRAYVALFDHTFDPVARQKAEASCRIAMELDPHSPEVLVTFGRLQRRVGKYEAAIASLRAALELRPQDPEALLTLSRAYESSGRMDEALDVAREIVSLRPEHWSGHNRVAMVHFLRGEFERAIPPWRKVMELTPDNVQVLGNLGAAYFQLGQLDDALAAYSHALAIAPSAGACRGAGTVQFFRGDIEESVRLLERALALSPRDARSWGNLGDAQRWCPGRESESRAAFDRAITLAREQLLGNPNDAEQWARLALWLSKRGQTSESLEALRRALALAPDHSGVLGRAITVHLLAGDEPCARTYFAQAIEKGYSWVELKRDPELELLRKDPATQKLLAAVETARMATPVDASEPGDAR